MSYLYKEYQPHPKGENEGEIKFAISFNKKTINWATSQPKKIGYQCTVIPVKRSKAESNSNFIIEESGTFTGFNVCLLEVDRQSKKRLQRAIEILQEQKQLFLDRFK